MHTWLAVNFKVEKNISQLRVTSWIYTHFHLVGYMDLVYNIILPEIRLNYNSRWAVDILQTGNFLISISVCEEMWYSTFFGYLVPRTLNLQFYKSQSSLKFHCDTASIDWTSFLEIVFFFGQCLCPTHPFEATENAVWRS